MNSGYDIFDTRERKAPAVLDKNKPIRTFLHYSDPQARETLTVFGETKDGLFYNYDDRLATCGWNPDGKPWHECLEIAAGTLAIDPSHSSQRTARLYELALVLFHKTDTVDLQHILLGCNVSNGFSYLVFGYTYQKSEKPDESSDRLPPQPQEDP